MPHYRFEQKEHFAVLLLNTKNHVISMPEVSVGSLSASVVHPREVFRAAIDHAAAAMILLHNHPSGDPTPSREDIAVTERLVKAGKIMDIPVLDHVVLGRDRFISLKEKGLLQG
jgi:DNA repair protein RadC